MVQIESNQGRVVSRPISVNFPGFDQRDENPSVSTINNATRVRGIRTTGFFDVPGGEGNIIQLNMMISSHASMDREAAVIIEEQTGDTVRQIFFRRISIPPGGGRRIVIEDVENKRLKVGFDSPRSHGLFPSVAVTQTFRADGAVVVLLFKSPAFFVDI